MRKNGHSYMARLATAVVLGSTHMAKGQNDTLVATNYAACEAYMTDLKTAFASAASMAEVKDIAYDQYMQNPSGPYVFCWTRTPEQVEDDASAMILSVHPYLDPVSLGELVQGNEPEYIEDKERVLLENLLNPTGSFFNYSETFNQVATQQADLAGTDKIDTTGQEQMILGFIEEDPSDPDLLVNCGCRFTGVPPGDRLNDNTANVKSGNSSAGALNATLVLFLSVVLGVTQIWV